MRHVILHGHIFKNAGTTFDWSLSRSFGDGFVDHREDKLMRERREKHLADFVSDNSSLLALSSHHLCYPLPQMEQVIFHTVYFLRHPVERIASVYAFERRQEADTLGAKAAKEKNFAEYVQWRMQHNVPRTIREYQTSNIAGYHDQPLRDQANADWLLRSSNHMLAIDCVGVVDRYEESMVVLEDRLSRFFPDLDLAFQAQNVTRPDDGKGVDERVVETLKKLGPLAADVLRMNSFDLALYRQANQQLDAALASIPDVGTKLDEFRERCSRLGSHAAR